MTAGRRPTPPGRRGNECRLERPHRDGIKNQTKSQLLQFLNHLINSCLFSLPVLSAAPMAQEACFKWRKLYSVTSASSQPRLGLKPLVEVDTQSTPGLRRGEESLLVGSLYDQKLCVIKIHPYQRHPDTGVSPPSAAQAATTPFTSYTQSLRFTGFLMVLSVL